MAACPEVRYDTAAVAHERLVGADDGHRALRLSPCGECRGWHLLPRRVTRVQWLARRRRLAAGTPLREAAPATGRVPSGR